MQRRGSTSLFRPTLAPAGNQQVANNPWVHRYPCKVQDQSTRTTLADSAQSGRFGGHVVSPVHLSMRRRHTAHVPRQRSFAHTTRPSEAHPIVQTISITTQSLRSFSRRRSPDKSPITLHHIQPVEDSDQPVFLFSPAGSMTSPKSLALLQHDAHAFYTEQRRQAQDELQLFQKEYPSNINDATLGNSFPGDDNDDIFDDKYLSSLVDDAPLPIEDNEFVNKQKESKPKKKSKLIVFGENGPQVLFITDPEDDGDLSSSSSSSSSSDEKKSIPLKPIVMYNDDYWQIDPITKKPLEPDPNLCCGNDCQNCVWIQYDEQMQKWEDSQAKM